MSDVLAEPGLLIEANGLVNLHEFHPQREDLLEHGVVNLISLFVFQVGDKFGRRRGLKLVSLR